MTPNYEKAKAEARKLLRDLGLSAPPIDPEFVAESIGVDVVYVKFEGETASKISGFYDVEEETIYINKEIGAGRKNFTIAHELGHHVMHREYAASENYTVMPRNNHYEGEKPSEEKEADAFAAELLVPMTMLKRYNKIVEPYELPTLFAVSPAMMKIRRKWL